ncbi:F-box/WD repeat-containing protein 8-like [Hoplias malabaricus]|uniref:F-box/WD repeat-containing protein 8-like n=1 Tax=Hoplias malabaricus TaxID=27720 RepID=UPI003462BB63
MAEDGLLSFREQWKKELEKKKELRNKSSFSSEGNVKRAGDSGCSNEDKRDDPNDQPQYVSIAAGLLDGRSSPLMERIEQERRKRTRKKRHYEGGGEEEKISDHQRKMIPLIDQLIQDLNETTDIPFFDVELPYELALKIFQFLSRADLGRCAQVSKSWRVLAEDEVLWYNLCLEEGYHSGASVCDSPCWKSTLRDHCNTEKAVMYNWKNRVGSVRHLQYELGKVLCDVSSSDGHIIAGYTSGDVRLWDSVDWNSGAFCLKPAHNIIYDNPSPHVSFVRVNETVVSAAYENGCVDVWSVEAGLEPIHHYQHLQGVSAMDLSSEGPVLTTACGLEVRVDAPDDGGYWKTRCLIQLPKPVDGVLVVPGKRVLPLVLAWANESVYLLDSSKSEDEEQQNEERLLHSVYGQPVTCLDTTACRAALGVKSCSWGMNDGGNKVKVYNLETCQSELSLGNSPGDFTCVNLRDAPPHLLVCGNKDRRVRVFDLRSGSSVVSLYAHQLGVTTVQADDWKIVSGGGEGLVCVWEMRMGAKLWEMHNRHPVRHIHFNSRTLVTANIPDERSPRGACITDDDLTAHRRHRGVICFCDFSVDSSTQDHVLPICRSSYSEISGYNYNIGLAMPYGTLTDPQSSGL